jgi:hypothetical protein
MHWLIDGTHGSHVVSTVLSVGIKNMNFKIAFLVFLLGSCSLVTRIQGPERCQSSEPRCDGNVLILCESDLEVSITCQPGLVCDATLGDCIDKECGNSVIDAGEQCDGNNLNNTDCTNQGFGGGTLACNTDCTFNITDCANEDCNIVGDEDNDGNVDCADPDCAADPICIEAGNCDDTVDNDLDGIADCVDSDCINEAVCVPFVPANPEVVFVGSDPVSVAVGDFNGDGKLDFAAANFISNDVSIRLGAGDGTFTSPTTPEITVGTGPTSVALGDFNGDDKLDFASANEGSDNVSIRLGIGNGTFSLPTIPEVTVGNAPFSVALGDFNGDGKLDFAATIQSTGNVSIQLGVGNGTFTSAVNVVVGTVPRSVALGDFNGDGKLDFASANQFSKNVSIRLAVGNGTFTSPTTPEVTVNDRPVSVALGDFNSDGKLDFATANEGSNDVSILLGVGNGTFSSAANFVVGNVPRSVALGDFNGDGNLDFVAANFDSNNVSIRLGVGNGTFSSAADVAVGDAPFSVALGDFNGDGKFDFATANSGSGNVSILLNTQ